MLRGKKGSGDLSSGVKIAIAFFGGIVTLIVLGFVLIVLSGNLVDSADDSLPILDGGRTENETSTSVNESGIYLTANSEYLPTCTIVHVTNASEPSEIISSGNYTQDNCFVSYSGNHVAGDYNDTTWNFTYDYTYKRRDARNMLDNVSIASADFFSNSTTWFSLLSIVIIIATVLIVLKMTKKTGGAAEQEQDL